MNDFMNDDDVICDVSSCYESSLLLGNDFGKNKLEPISYDLHHKFVHNSTKAYQVEFREVLKILNFGDEDNQGIVEISINYTSIKDLLDPVTNRRTDSVLLFLEEENMETITA